MGGTSPKIKIRRTSTQGSDYGDVTPVETSPHEQKGSSTLWVRRRVRESFRGRVEFRYGQWSEEISEGSSSNWRELNNLIETLEEWEKAGKLDGVELFLFTDNMTAEAAFWKGSSKSKTLFQLILRLKQIEMKGNFVAHVIHVSGKRMIAQGTDGISRGDHTEGVMIGKSMKEFVPIHRTAFERSPNLSRWMDYVNGARSWTLLTPEDWFGCHQEGGTYVWAPPPAVGDVVVEELGRSRQMRPRTLHLIVIPRLMTGRWRRHLTRHTDLYFKMDKAPFWNLDELHEPCLVFVALPYETHNPCLKRRQRLVECFTTGLCTGRVHKDEGSTGWDNVRELLVDAWRLCPM